MTKKHLVFIINPKSGVDRKKPMRQTIDEALNHAQFSYEILHTKFAKHGIELASKAAADGAFAVVAVGGDGSINDVVQGLMGSHTALAIIPKGSGNGMARTLNIPLHDREAIELINKGKYTMMDLAFANGKPFISTAGVAFDALISKKFSTSKKRGFGRYSWLVFKHLWTYKAWQWQIKMDGDDKSERAFIVNIANGQQFGYNFIIAPEADWTDGLLDVIVVHKFPKLYGAVLMLRALTGTITSSRYVKHFRAREVMVSHPELKWMHTDGDVHSCENEVRFTVQQGAQKVLVP